MVDILPEEAALARLCRLDAAQRGLLEGDTRQCSRIADHLDGYLQIERDNPKLIWLYSLILEDGVALPGGGIVAAMKKRLLDESLLTPVAWRYLANWTAQDFQVVIHQEDPAGEPHWRWHTLIAWLQILSGMRLTSPLASEIQGLFLHDGLVVVQDPDEVLFRGAWMRFHTLRSILKEADTRLRDGTFSQFSESELVDVLTWLAATEPDLDGNQAKSGWKYLSRTATDWKADKLAIAKYPDLRWDSALPRIQIASWAIEAIADAWSMRQLALSQHHCADRYIEACRNGTDRIFVIRPLEGTIAATLRIVSVERTWVVKDLKGFANSAVPAPLCNLAQEIAHRYTKAANASCAGSFDCPPSSAAGIRAADHTAVPPIP